MLLEDHVIKQAEASVMLTASVPLKVLSAALR